MSDCAVGDLPAGFRVAHVPVDASALPPEQWEAVCRAVRRVVGQLKPGQQWIRTAAGWVRTIGPLRCELRRDNRLDIEAPGAPRAPVLLVLGDPRDQLFSPTVIVAGPGCDQLAAAINAHEGDGLTLTTRLSLASAVAGMEESHLQHP